MKNLRLLQSPLRRVFAAATLGLLGACASDQTPAGPTTPEPDQRLQQVSDTLTAQVRQSGATVVEGDAQSERVLSISTASPSATDVISPASGMTAVLVGQTKAPTVRGLSLPATHVVRGGKKKLMYVSYAWRGEENLGAIDVFDIENPATPRLVATVLFTDTKVRALTLSEDGTTLFTAGTTSADIHSTVPAMVERFPLDSRGVPIVAQGLRRAVRSYASLSVAEYRGTLYVSSGAGGTLPNGGITVMNAATLRTQQAFAFDDARAIAASSAGVVSLEGPNSGITTGAVRSFRMSLTGISYATTQRLTGLTTGYDKGVIQLDGDLAFTTNGARGAAILRPFSTSSILTTIPAASGQQGITNGIDAVSPSDDDDDDSEKDDDDDNTNGVIATADGSAGVRIWSSDYPTKRTSGTPSLTLKGTLSGSMLPGSANHVALSSDAHQIIVANGDGAVRIFRLALSK